MDDKQIFATMKNDLSWLQRHERIVIAVFILATVLLIGNKWINYSAQNAHDAATVAVQQLDEQKKANTQLAQQVAQQQLQYQQLTASVAQQNAEIMAAISARNADLNKQQTKDKTLALPDLAKRWQGLAGLNDRDLTWNDTPCLACPAFGITEEGARQTVIQLEQIPVLQSNLKDTQQTAQNDQTQLTKANELIAGFNTQVSGLNAQLKAADFACRKEKDDLKDNERKSKRNWFISGLASGAAAVAYIVFHYR
jgi:multidrug efflux pump subunit AcrA (membrane-fusion protein)